MSSEALKEGSAEALAVMKIEQITEGKPEIANQRGASRVVAVGSLLNTILRGRGRGKQPERDSLRVGKRGETSITLCSII